MSRPRGSGRRLFENFLRLERKKRLGSRALQAPAGLLPGASPRRWIAVLLAFYSDPHPRRFLPTLRSPVASPPHLPGPLQRNTGHRAAGTRAPGRRAEGRRSAGPLSAGSTAAHTCALHSGGRGASRGPPPASPPPPARGESRRTQDLHGRTRWDLRIGFGADDRCLAVLLLSLLLAFLTQGRKTKTQNCGIYLT